MSTHLTGADPSPAAPLSSSRTRVLDALQRTQGSLTVGDVAEQVGLHPNTARFHLDALVDAGLVTRTSEHRDSPGRPRMLYAATAEGASAGPRSYRLLSEVLTSYVASVSKHPDQAGLEAGEAWGHYLADRPRPFQRVTAKQATDQLVQTLEDIGFAPEPVTSGHKRQILLHHCPFHETAEHHREVVCAVHLGLMRGVLAETRAPLDVERLDPFVEPNLCIARLIARRSKSD